MFCLRGNALGQNFLVFALDKKKKMAYNSSVVSGTARVSGALLKKEKGIAKEEKEKQITRCGSVW